LCVSTGNGLGRTLTYDMLSSLFSPPGPLLPSTFSTLVISGTSGVFVSASRGGAAGVAWVRGCAEVGHIVKTAKAGAIEDLEWCRRQGVGTWVLDVV
jgi:hypothetical protein